jgi:NAD(P)-dependent dehydrogenase (short-subunit alcohol dehydrogenase family)
MEHRRAHLILSKKIALVTGGTGALGSAIAERLSSQGARVTATYRSDVGLAQVTGSFKQKVALVKADVTDEREVRELYDGIVSAWSHIDIVVNAIGGFLPKKPLTEVTLDDWELMMNINLKSTFLSTREALRRMKGRGYGRIVNISAKVGLDPTPGRTAYAISKAGVSLLTDLVAQEVKGTGITVNAIAPSIIATPANVESMPDQDRSTWVTPDQIADIVCYLSSPDAGGITGTTIKAYGGV